MNAASSHGSPFVFVGGMLVTAWLALTPLARAEDVTTLSGTTYHQVRVVRVEPDGVTWAHAAGLCKVDFTDLPEAVRKTYHFDPKQATAYRTVQARSRQQVTDRMAQNQQDVAVWKAAHSRASSAAPGGTEAADGHFVYRRGPSAATKSVTETMEAKATEQKMLTKDDGTIWDHRLWTVPTMIIGRSTADISADPVVDPSTYEYRASLHHTPGAYAPDSLHDNFYQGDYMTKAYYKDVERAEAFARGHP